MKNILFLNTIQDKAWKNRALFLMLALVMSIGNAWGNPGHGTHYGKVVLQNATGHGTVYLSTEPNKDSDQTGSSDPGNEGGQSWITWNCDGSESNDEKTYYARGTAIDGYYYAGWAETESATTYKLATEGKSLRATSEESNKPSETTIYGFFKPNVKITETPAVEIWATFNPEEDSQADTICKAEFYVENAESIADFVDPPTIEGDDSDKFSNPQIMSYADNKVTINFVYNGNKEVGTHNATLTLKVIDKKGGTDQTYGSKTIPLIVHNEQKADNDARVIAADGTTIIYEGDWATALTNANANAGCTLQLLRDIDLGTITATNNITKAMTIDLNSRTLQAAVNKASTGLLTLNAAVEVTIKDSKTGGKIINEHALNGQMRAISIDKAGAILNIQSGTIRVNNTGQYASAANADLGVDKYSACTARGIYQNANTTVNISGGRIEAVGTREVYGIVEASSAANTTYLNITGGEIYAEAPAYAYGICAFGKVNMSAGVINTHITTDMVDARYAADHANNANNGYGYGIYVQTNAYATPNSCYAGTLNMTGGTVNVVSDRTKAATLPNYGIYINTKVASVGAGKTATDGTQSEKASAAASIENATINVTSGTNYSYGVVARGSYNSYDQTYRKSTIKNSIINVKANTYAYGVYADAVINSASYAYGAHAGKIELTDNNNITATTTGKNAFGVYVHAVSNATAVDVVAAEVEITGGIYKASAANTTAYAVHSAAKQVQGEKETAPSIVIISGKFWSEATSAYADISPACVPGYCVVKGGYYKNDANVSSVLQEGYNVFPLQQNKAEHKEAYNEGYRWHVTPDVTGEAVWEVYNNTNTLLGTFDNLNSALELAKGNTNSKVVPTTNYTLPAGNYTIPSGVTLLIPYEATYKNATNEPDYYEDDTNTAPTPFRTLTLAKGVAITVNGSINVNAKLRSRQNTNGAQGGKSGMINMQEDSEITLNNGANLYCWGIIYGEGEITANSGANVYESFQVNDYPGGSFLSGNVYELKENKVFPIRIYCFPNIQTKLHLHYGATEKVATAFASFGLQKDIVFISSNAGLFVMQDGSILTKWYDTNNDLQRFELKGDANLKSVAFNVGYMLPIVNRPYTVPINSNEFVLPISHNMHIELLPQSDTISSTVTLTEDIAILPGAKISVGKNVTVKIAENKAPYIYDLDQWENNYTYAAFPTNAASNKNNFSIIYGREKKCSFLKEDLSDAVLEVAGTIEVNGALYTTESGADIKGIDGGKIIINTPYPTTLPTIYQVIQDPKEYVPIPITAAQLHNDTIKNPDYHYTQTSGAGAGDEFWYVESLGKWVNEFGPELDIVDADNTKKTLTINANGWASSGWPYTVDGVKYEKGDREDDRTLIIPYNGTAGASLPIAVLDKDGKPICRHIYKVPFVYTGTENMDAMNENSIVFVKSGTLTVGTASAKEIYVAPGAELKVTGTLTVGKLVLRTTPFDAAILTNKGTIVGQVYYSRIARDTDFHLFAIPAGSNTAGVVLSDGTSAAVASTVAPYGNAWQLREYNTARRAEKGDDGANWNNIGWDNIVVNGDTRDTTYSDVAIEASKGYELRSGSKYYREYLFPVTLPTTADSVGVTAATGAAGAAHAGWNILCSPYTYIYTAVYNDPARGIKVSWQYQELDGSYSYKQVQPDQIKPAVPFAYQTKENGSLDFSADSLFFKAPRKQSAAEALTETEWVHLDIFDAYGEGDETSLFVHPTRFEQTYKTGIDVAKQSLTASRAILYTAHAYGNMAFAGVADTLLENGIDVIVYSPTEQQLTFSLRENAFLNRLEYLWLADNKTGARTDLLLNDYTFRAAAGTDKQRFVLNGRFKAPQITTNITNTVVGYNIYAIGNNIAISGVEQGTPIYVFDAVGHMIYTTAATSDEVIVPAPCAGVYLLSVGGQTAKLVINQ